jgi:succinate dehydrogenase / fumarate reductase, membrane anchor subunit
MRTPLGRVRYLGSAHGGTQDFWRQRLTGAAGIVLALLAAGIIAAAAGRPYPEAAHIVGSPLAAAVFVLLFAVTAVHMRIGMQVIIEDYITTPGLKVVALAANTFFSYAVAAVAIVAVLRLAAGG